MSKFVQDRFLSSILSIYRLLSPWNCIEEEGTSNKKMYIFRPKSSCSFFFNESKREERKVNRLKLARRSLCILLTKRVTQLLTWFHYCGIGIRLGFQICPHYWLTKFIGTYLTAKVFEINVSLQIIN